VKHPFIVGDIVYSPVAGAGSVVSLLPEYGGDYVLVDYGKGSVAQHNRTLSFSEWPKPNHTRPTEDGYYLVQFKNFGRVYLAHHSARRGQTSPGPWALISPNGKPLSDHTYGVDGSKVKPLQFLGTDIGAAFKPQ